MVRWEVGGGRWEVRGGRWEVGGGRWEVGEVGGGRGGRLEVGEDAYDLELEGLVDDLIFLISSLFCSLRFEGVGEKMR